MVCGDFGAPSLTAHVKGFSILNALLALLSVIFGIIGCVSYTNSNKSISTAPWTEYESANTDTSLPNDQLAFGLRAYVEYTQVKGSDKVFTSLVTYKSCTTGDTAKDFCVTCDKSGAAVVSMCSLALIAAFVAFLAHLLRVSCDSAFNKDISVLGGITSVVFGVIAFSVAQPCDTAIKTFAAAISILTEIENEVTFGLGAKLTASSFCLMLILTVFSLIIPVGQVAEPVPQGEVTKV